MRWAAILRAPAISRVRGQMGRSYTLKIVMLLPCAAHEASVTGGLYACQIDVHILHSSLLYQGGNEVAAVILIAVPPRTKASARVHWGNR